MATFDANSVGSIGYDFSTWEGPAGTVPEPSDSQIDELMTDIRAAMKKYDLEVDEQDQASDLTEKMDQAGEGFFTEMQEDLIKAYAKVCSQNPSEKVLRALPYRVRNKFFGYLMGELTNPES